LNTSRKSRQTQFEKLFKKNQHKFARIARSYAGARYQQDLLQEIWHQIWRSMDNFKYGSNIDTWAYRVALNTAISFVRKDQKHNQVIGSEVSADLNKNEASQSGSMSEAMFLVIKFLSILTDLDKAAFLMYLDGFDHQQISETLAISANNVAVKINRMKAKFEQLYLE